MLNATPSAPQVERWAGALLIALWFAGLAVIGWAGQAGAIVDKGRARPRGQAAAQLELIAPAAVAAAQLDETAPRPQAQEMGGESLTRGR